MSSVGGESASIEVVVLDNQAVLREGLVALLERQPALRVTAQANAVRQLGELASEPRVVITSLDLADGRGPSVVEEVARQVPGASILVVSDVSHPSIVVKALTAGAIGYVLSSASAGEFFRALKSVAAKERHLQPEVAEAVDRWQGPDSGPAIALRHLSGKETEVLRLLALGHTNSEIASTIGVSLRTIETHRARIFHKLGLQTRAELVRYAFDEGLIAAR